MDNLLNKEKVTDLLATALEGGSNYWYELPNLEEVFEKTPYMDGEPIVDRIIEAVYNHNVSIIVTDCEDGIILGEFNLESITNGEMIMREKHHRHFIDAYDETDDADTADVWFQCCVMGEVVYG